MAGKGLAPSMIGLFFVIAGAAIATVGVFTHHWGTAQVNLTAPAPDFTNGQTGLTMNVLGQVTTDLWKVCFLSQCESVDYLVNFKIIRWCAYSGMFFSLFAGFLAVANIIKTHCIGQAMCCLSLISHLSGFLACLCIQFGAAMYASMIWLAKDAIGEITQMSGTSQTLQLTHITFGYSFFMFTVGGALAAIGALMGFLANSKCETNEAAVLEKKMAPGKYQQMNYYI